MYLATLLAFLGVLAATVCNAQTFSSCNPTVNISCPADPAISTPFTSDFTKGSSALTGWTTTAGSLTYDTSGSGALFTINKRGDAPTIQSTGYLFFGYVEVKMKAAAGQGIISSIVLESDDLDEVDWEFIGGTDSGVQTNYFGKGNTTTYDRMIPYNVATPQEVSHTYALNWTADSLVWLIDNVPQRTLHYADAVGGKNYPQTPMNVRIGIWAGGDPSNSAGTITWAGGPTDYTKAPFTMSVESVKIINYTPGTSYSYSDMSGSYQSIKVAGAGNPSG
ncbi:glycoside hydrolase family 16 protein, partial [Lepidopterella palustris CBS 459.81]